MWGRACVLPYRAYGNNASRHGIRLERWPCLRGGGGGRARRDLPFERRDAVPHRSHKLHARTFGSCFDGSTTAIDPNAREVGLEGQARCDDQAPSLPPLGVRDDASQGSVRTQGSYWYHDLQYGCVFLSHTAWLCAPGREELRANGVPEPKWPYLQAKTEGVKGGNGAKKHCQIVQDLALVTAESLVKFKDLLTDIEDDPGLLSQMFEVNTGVNALTEAIQGCTDLFRRNASSPRINKKIILITDNDEPYPPRSKLRNAANERRNDLADMDHKIEPFFFSPPDHEFDLENFYGKFITMVKEDDNNNEDDDEKVADVNEIPIPWPLVHHDIVQTLSEMIDNLRTKEAMKRVQFQIPFTLAEGTTIGIKGYALVGVERLRLPTKIDLNTSHADAVVHKIFYKDATSDDLNVKTDIRKYFEIGKADPDKGSRSAQIFFTEAEIRKVKTLGLSPSMSLLGFVSRSEFLKYEETIKHGYFIRPDEDAYSGSTRTFVALMESMIKKGVIAYASLLIRISGRPQIVILDAQEEVLNQKTGIVERPAGINIYQLPFADDLRKHRLDSTPSIKKPYVEGYDEPEQPEIALATAIVKKLTRVYDPNSYPNPAINFFQETLAATALDDELPDPIDKTIPAYGTIRDRAGEKITQLKSLIAEDELDPALVRTSNKKRAHTPEATGSAEEIQEFADKMTRLQNKVLVADLKDGLKLMGESTSGTKPVLWDRAIAALTEKGLWAKGDGASEAAPKTKRKKKITIEDNDEDE